jgi:lipoprotein-anchoring transpeptidase ErfK/SrfK
VALLAAMVALGLTTTACGSGSSDVGVAASTTGSGQPATAGSGSQPSAGTSAGASGKGAGPAQQRVVQRVGTATQQKVTVSDVSLVARAAASSIKVYPSLTGTTPQWTLKNPLPSGAPLVFLVLERRGDRLRVLVPVRPNESQGWIRVADVTLSQHDFRIAISVGKYTLTLFKAGKVTMQVPVGLGTGSTPTPGGVFYTKELLRPPNPAGPYGPYAYGLSGYSPVLENFGGGNGEIGIHGTNEPASLGANVSHGCIRMSNADITKLAGMLPLGVPVQIVS